MPSKKAKDYAQDIGALFFETSAKEDSGKVLCNWKFDFCKGLKELFNEVVEALVQRSGEYSSIEETGTRIVHMKSGDSQGKKEGCPC